MIEERGTDFCSECRKETEYALKTQTIKGIIDGKEYKFAITVAICTECGEEMSPPGLLDRNIQEIGDQYEQHS